MPAQNSPSGRPEIPPDIPPEFVDAYLAGFQRGYGGEVDLQATESEEASEREAFKGFNKLDRPTDQGDDPTDELDAATGTFEPPTVDIRKRGLDKLDRPAETPDRPAGTPDGAEETHGQQSEASDRPTQTPERPGRSRPNTDRPEDMEWLFERDRDAPLGWAFNPADEDSKADRAGSKGTGGGSTSTATEETGPSSSRTGRSPWVVLIGFLAILVVLMLVAYIGGMAFSTIADR